MSGLAVVFAPGSTENADANGDTRTIYLHHAHTRETISATYLVGGQYDSGVLEKLNWFLRDWRRDEPTKMDPKLFDVIWQVYRESGSSQPVEVMSAYRSPETNAMLRRRSRGVAEHSQHILGKAMDQHYVDVPMSRIREIAMRLERGGVGFYPTAGTPFVHMDVGGVRHWPRMSYDQLARLFPDGKTVHIPSNGQPMARYEEARAELEARGDSFSYPTATEVKSKGFFAWLFGGGDDEEDAAAAGDTGSRRRQTRVASAQPGVPTNAPSAMLYGTRDDGGVRAFNLGSSASSVPSPTSASFEAAAPSPASQRRSSARTAVQQAALDPAPAAAPVQQAATAPAPTSDIQAEETLARAMTDPRQKPAVSFGDVAPAPMPLAGVPARSAAIGLTAFAPMPPVRPVELAVEGPRAPLPPNRPVELVAALGPKSDRAPGVTASSKDAIGALIASSQPVRTASLPSVITQGLGAPKTAQPPRIMAYAGPAMPGPPQEGSAPLPVARPAPFVAARLDRSNFRSLTGSGSAARAVIHSGLGSAASALRPAAQAALGTITGTPAPLSRGFGTSATELTSDRFSGSVARSRTHLVTSPSSGG